MSSAHCLVGAMCQDHMQFPSLLPKAQKWQLACGVFISYCLCLCMHAVMFSPLRFLCILLLKETFVQVQALP